MKCHVCLVLLCRDFCILVIRPVAGAAIRIKRSEANNATLLVCLPSYVIYADRRWHCNG